MKIRRLHFKSGLALGLHIARLDEHRSFVLVTEEFRKALGTSKLCEFSLPSDIKP